MPEPHAFSLTSVGTCQWQLCDHACWRRGPVILQLTRSAAKALDVAGRENAGAFAWKIKANLALTALSDSLATLVACAFGASAQHTIRREE